MSERADTRAGLPPTMDIQDLLETLPHRYPFLMVDRITEWDPEKARAVGIKNVTVNEPFFQGHFPGRPIMPGVLLIEAMAQVAATLAMRGMKGYQVYLLGVDDFRIRKPVVPGDQLRIEIQVTKVKGIFWRFEAKASVDGEERVSGEFLASVMSPDGKPVPHVLKVGS